MTRDQGPDRTSSYAPIYSHPIGTTGVTYEPGTASVMRPSDPNRAIRGYLLFILIVVTISAGLTFALSSLSKKTYAAEAQVVVNAGLGMETTGNGDVLTAPRIAQTYATLAMSRPVLLEVISRAELSYDATELATHLKVSADPASPFISIVVSDDSPTRVELTANALADILVERASTPAVPATPATPTTPAIPATPRQDILAIIERAIVPTDPSGPRVMLNTALAAAAAFVLALAVVAGVVYVREVQPTWRTDTG
jgi:capsular polysaccharide biosynthesis protein